MPFFRHYYTTFDYGGQSESASSVENKKPSIWVAEATESCEPKKHQELLQIEAGKEKGSTPSLLEVDQSQLRLPHWMGKKDGEHLQFWISEYLFWIAWGSDKGHKCLRSLSAADLTGPNLGSHNPACGRDLGQKKNPPVNDWKKKWQKKNGPKRWNIFQNEASRKIHWRKITGSPSRRERRFYQTLNFRTLFWGVLNLQLSDLSWNPKEPGFSWNPFFVSRESFGIIQLRSTNFWFQGMFKTGAAWESMKLLL